MDFIFPWKSDLNFKSYISDHKDFVGREWMTEDIAYELLHTDRRGLLIAAEMGFGKSALISHIACSHDKMLSAYPIYEKTVGIHMCRHDSNLTLSPGIFVRNIAGKLAEHFPEFGNILNTENMASGYLTNSKCIQDPNGCFDHTILYPLQKSKSNQNIIIMIIDALDECIGIGPRDILTLLNQKIHLLPHNIKFLFTSRNISSIRVNLPPGISLDQTPLFREKSLGDIKKYISQRLKNSSVNEQYQTLLSSSNLHETLEKLADLVDGNFLFLVHAFDFWVEVGNINAFPSELDHIYHLNVKRIFSKPENIFKDVRSVIEILCASHGSIEEYLLYEVLDVDDPERMKYLSRILLNQLSHFIQISSGRVVFTNKRIADFFSRQDNIENDFYIFQQNGHGLIAKYWLANLEKEHAINVSFTLLKDIFRHVTCSEDKSLRNKLIDLVHNRINENKYSFLMHYIAASLNSYDSMFIAIRSMPHLHIDTRDPWGSTASFIASAYGNENALAALIKHGSDIHYQRPPPVFLQLKLVQDPIHFCKYKAFCGYNLANIASQNGHANVLKLLIQYKINLCHENSLGLNSFHLASEHAHVHILQILMSSKLCNWTSSFDQALYLSAKNGHVPVVKYLLSIHAVDNCVPCLNFYHWIPKGKARLQTNTRIPNLPYERDYKNYVLKDDRRLYFCESALDIAVQKNNLEVVKSLVNQKENALKCINAQGMTPAITAVVFDSRDVIYYFLQSGLPLNDTCTVRQNMKKRFTNNEGDLSNDRLCLNNVSFWHMLAIYSSSGAITYIRNSPQYDYIWNLTDPTGDTPVHYAFCNILLGQEIISRLASHMLARSLSGATPAHAAALCGNVYPIILLMKHHKLRTDIKDYENKNILHYLAISTRQYIHIDFLSQILNESYEKLISEQDSDGRTPLHYAAMSGNTLLIKNSNWDSIFRPTSYMIQDKFNLSVLDILFKYMPSRQPIFEEFLVTLPYDCSYDDLFRTPGCSGIRSNILDAFEMFAFKAFTDLRKTNLMCKRVILGFMYKSLKKNRFYLIHMIKIIFPKFYQSISARKMHFFLAQLLKKPSYPNSLLSSTFLPDLFKNACKSKNQYGYLWYIFHDSQRKFWHMYLTLNSTIFLDSVKSVLSKCTQKGLLTAALKGGNVLPLIMTETDIGTYDDFELSTLIYEAPNIIPLSNYLTPKIYYKIKTDYIWHPDLIPYSHPFVIESLLYRESTTLQTVVPCCQHVAKLSYHHVISAKGLSSAHDEETNENMKNCKNKYSVTPNQLAYFFNHSLSYHENIDVSSFYRRHFAALFFKVTMDFHSFVFPKSSKAWICFQYVHKINRKFLKKLLCLASLENEICRLISKLYLMDWRVIFQIYTLNKLKIYIDHEFQHSFDFVSYIKHVRTICQHRTNTRSFSQVEKYHITSNIVDNNCSNTNYFSKFCLKHISFLNRQRKNVNFKLTSVLEMYFPLCYLIYHKFIIELPDLAKKNTIEIIQIMNTYAYAPFFHNNPKYNYWNELKSRFADPFRTMTRNILTSDITKIISWIRYPEFHLNRYTDYKQVASFNSCLSVYENLTKHDST